MDSLKRCRVEISLLLALLTLIVTNAAQAQNGDNQPDELITDRPDQTESAAVVGKGRVQIEAGWLFTRSDDAGVRVETQEVPGTLARIGLSRRVELRVGWAGHVSSDVDVRGAGGLSTDFDGFGDAELGVKVRLAEESGARPEIAILAASSIPTGDRDFTSDRADPSFRLSMAHTLSETVGLGYNFGLEWESAPSPGGGTTTLSRAIYTVAAGFSLSDRVGAFAELFGDMAGSADGGPLHLADGGFTFLLRDNLQLDVAAGVGLNDRADDWFLGLGVSVRLPN